MCVHVRIRFGSWRSRRRAPVFVIIIIVIIKEPIAVTLSSSGAHVHTRTQCIYYNVYIAYVCVESIPLYERSLTSWLVRDGCSRHVKHANGFDIIIVCDGRTDGLGVDNAFCSRVRTVYTACPGSILYIDFYHTHARYTYTRFVIYYYYIII